MNKKGFTLAEVLITLGIIGVVAALTMPMLITKIEKTVLTGQLKDTYTVLNKGLALMLAKEGVDEVYETDLWKYSAQGDSASANATFKKYFNTVNYEYRPYSIIRKDIIEYMDVNTSHNSNWCDTNHFYQLTNGSEICFWPAQNSINDEGFINVDVNGNKKPNKYGRDIFSLRVDDGKVVSSSIYNSNNCFPRYTSGCVDRIIKAGWKMEY